MFVASHTTQNQSVNHIELIVWGGVGGFFVFFQVLNLNVHILIKGKSYGNCEVVCISHTSKRSTPKAVPLKKLKHAFVLHPSLRGGDGGLTVCPVYMHTRTGLCSTQANMSQLSRNLRRMCSDKTKSRGPAET